MNSWELLVFPGSPNVTQRRIWKLLLLPLASNRNYTEILLAFFEEAQLLQ